MLVKLKSRQTDTCRTCKNVCRMADGTLIPLCGILFNQGTMEFRPLKNAAVDPDHNFCENYEKA